LAGFNGINVYFDNLVVSYFLGPPCVLRRPRRNRIDLNHKENANLPPPSAREPRLVPHKLAPRTQSRDSSDSAVVVFLAHHPIRENKLHAIPMRQDIFQGIFTAERLVLHSDLQTMLLRWHKIHTVFN